MNTEKLKPIGKMAVALVLIILMMSCVTLLIQYSYSGALGDMDSPIVNRDVSYHWATHYPTLLIVSSGLFLIMVLVDYFIFSITGKTTKHPLEMIPYWIVGMVWVAAVGFTMSFFYYRGFGCVITAIVMVICGSLAGHKPTNDPLPEEFLTPLSGVLLYALFRFFKLPLSVLTGIAIAGFVMYIIIRIVKRNHEFTIRQSILSMVTIGIGSILTWYGTTLTVFPPLVLTPSTTYFYEKGIRQYTVNITQSIPDSLLKLSEGNWQLQNFDSLAVATIHFTRCRDSVTLHLPEKNMPQSDIKKMHERYWKDWSRNNKSTGDIYFAFTRQEKQFHRGNPHD
jgi:hypothetical protein